MSYMGTIIYDFFFMIQYQPGYFHFFFIDYSYLEKLLIIYEYSTRNIIIN